MPKEQARMSEHNPCATSSKNAKDKSNNTTLLAMRDTKDTDDSSGRGSRCSSEKDSGYSDGSDWQQTDGEDQQSNKSQSRASEHAQTSQQGQNQQLGQRNPGNGTCMPSGRDHSPIYIIRDIVLKQPSIIQKRDQLLWKNGIRENNFPGSPHRILLQQPSLVPAALQLHKPLFRKSNVTGKKVNGSYLPILNSYPRIAPHPSKKPLDKSSSNHEAQNLSKRVCTDPKSGDTHVTRGLPEQHLHKQPKLAASGLPCFSLATGGLSSSTSTATSTSQGSPSVSAISFLTGRGHHRDATTSTRHRRFLNTVELLRQSGLLDITLRTKELLRQSNAIERDIAQLRQHTELLCQAANNPNHCLNNITAWEHLHRTMVGSGSYPDLKALQNLQIPPHPDPDRIFTGDTNRSQAAESSGESPSPLLENILDQNCTVSQQALSEPGRKLKNGDKSSDNVTFMSPDSSTG